MIGIQATVVIILQYKNASNPPAKAGDSGDIGSISGLRRFPEEGNGNRFQYSCLGNPTERESLVGYSSQGHKE